MKPQSLYILLLCFLLLSCSTNKTETSYVSFSDIYKDLTTNGKNKIVVLTDSTHLKKRFFFLDLIKQESRHYSIAFLSDINSPENSVIKSILRPLVLPVTCIFDSENNLIDIIPGSENESIEYIKYTLRTGLPNNDFHYNQIYGKTKKELLERLNILLPSVTASSDIVFPPVFYHTLYKYDKNPYYLYLEILSCYHYDYINDVLPLAHLILSHTSTYDLYYGHEYIEFANQIIHPEKASGTPFIHITTSHKDNEGIIEISNSGSGELTIYKIRANCSCIHLDHIESPISIENNENISLKYSINTTSSDSIQNHHVYIISNSSNKLISTISLHE